MTDLFDRCPSFDACSAPDCPLDLPRGQRVVLPGEGTCIASRESRERIAVDAGVDPQLVLLPRERNADAARQVWHRLTEDVRARILAAGARGRRAASAPGSRSGFEQPPEHAL